MSMAEQENKRFNEFQDSVNAAAGSPVPAEEPDFEIGEAGSGAKEKTGKADSKKTKANAGKDKGKSKEALKKEKAEAKKQAKLEKQYPHKKYLNLAVKEKSGVNLLVAIPLILLLCVGAAVFSKYMIVDRFAEVEQAEAAVAALQRSADTLTAYVADYAEVEEEYQRYSTKWMTNEESGTVSRLEMLALIEEEFMANYDVMNISSTGNVISLKIAGADLETMSGIVQKLYDRPDVAKVEVSSANNTEIVTQTTTVENEDGTEEEVEEELVIDVITVIITMKQVEEEEAAA